MPQIFGDDFTSFDPAIVDILGVALEDAWKGVVNEGTSPINDPQACRSALASYIIENAKKGERNPAKLVEDALFRWRF